MDPDIIKLLQSVNKLVASIQALGGSGSSGGVGQAIRDKLKGTIQDRKDKSTAKTFQTITEDLKDNRKAVIGLSKSMMGLTKRVDKTSDSFSTLQTQMAKFGSMLGMSGGGGGGRPNIPGMSPAPGSSGPAPGVMRAQNQTLLQQGQGVKQVLGTMLQNVASTSAGLGGLATVITQVGSVLKTLGGQFFDLARIGFGSLGSLRELSIDAFKAGMSLKEYTKLIEENQAFAARTGSLEQFGKIISASDAQLAQMGVFGQEAKNLQASLAQSNTIMGVSTNGVADANARQIAVFDQLRKTTSMTAGEFANLVKTVAESDQTQREILSLGPQEKQARMAELLQITSTGQRLGLTAKASQDLAAAMIAQRKDTVKSRFEQAGRIQQLAAFAGQGEKGERAAQLLRKGRGASAAEAEELRGLLASIDKASEGIYQAGDFAQQNAIDQMGPDNGQLGAAGEIMKASRAATNTAEAGAATNNKDFGQHVDKFGQAVGNLTVFARGFEQSIGPAIASAIGGALLLAFKGPIVSLLGKALGLGGGASGGVMQGLGSAAKSLLSPLTTARTAIAGFGTGVGGFFKNIMSVFSEFKVALGGGLLGNVMGGVAGFSEGIVGILQGGWSLVKGIGGIVAAFGPAAGLFDSIVEAFTGEVSNALDPGGGVFARIGGMVTAFFSAIPNMIIGAIQYVFGGADGPMGEIVGNLKNGFGQVASWMSASVKLFLASIVNGVGSLLSVFLPDKSPLIMDMKKWGQQLSDSADKSFATFDKLADDHTQTLSTVSAANTKAAESTEKATKAATVKATAAQKQFDNVQYGATTTAAQVIEDAKTIMGSAKEATTILATPQVQNAPTIAPATVNTPDAQNAVDRLATQTTIGVNSTADLAALLTQILATLNKTMNIEENHADLTAMLVDRSRPQATFTPAEVTARQLLHAGGQ
jgi:hypothetical protein